MVLGIDHDYDLQVAFELHVIEHVMVQHDVVIVGVKACKTREIVEVNLTIVGFLATSAWALGTLIEIAHTGIRSPLANLVQAEVQHPSHEFLFAVSPIGDHVAQKA